MTRVEGHGKVTMLLDDDNRVHQARLHIVEFRGFEAFIEGRPYWEVPVTVQRLCGICPVSHHLAAAKAMDIIAGYGPLTPTAEKLRRLLHYGQMVQSHALHFFHLASPDLLLGFESEVAKRNIVGVAAAFPDLAKQGVLTRKFGQEVIRHIVGKRIHGTGCIPGGINKALTQAERDVLRADIDQIIAWSREAVGLARRLHETQPEFYAHFGESRANMMGFVDADGALDFYHGGLRAQDADGATIFDHVDYATYRELLREEIKPWSYMKFPHIRSLGRGERLVSRRSAGAGADRRSSAVAAGRRGAQDVPRRRRRQAGARRAVLPLGAHDRDAARGRARARSARRSRHPRHGSDGRQGAAPRRGGRRDRGAARHALPPLQASTRTTSSLIAT